MVMVSVDAEPEKAHVLFLAPGSLRDWSGPFWQDTSDPPATLRLHAK